MSAKTKNNKEYNAKSIKVMTDREHVRKYYGMYGFDVNNPSQCFIEIFDNAIDEIVECEFFDDYVEVIIAGSTITVVDYGRGVPLDSIDIVFGQLRSSGKFDKKSNITGYGGATAGTYGIGAAAVNFLCENFTVEVRRDGEGKVFIYQNGELKRKKNIDNVKKSEHMTKVTFNIDKTIFNVDIDSNFVLEYIKNIVFLNPDIKVKLIVNDKETIIDKEFISEMINELNSMEKVSVKTNDVSIKIYMKYDESLDLDSNIRSFVNNKETKAHGEHVNLLIDTLSTLYKVDKKYVTMNLRAYVICYMHTPSLLAQTKVKLLSKFSDVIPAKLLKEMKQNPNIPNGFFEIVKSNIQKYEQLTHKKTIARIRKAGIDDFFDCEHDKGELIIVEGKSAGSGLIRYRDKKSQAILLLRGKILNVEKASSMSIKENKVINSLLSVIDRFDKVLFATDADEDGLHIQYLLSLFANKFFKNNLNKFYIIDLPLFCVRKGSNVITYTNNVEQYKEGYNITRFKGLGEMEGNDLKDTILDKNKRKLIPISIKYK